MFDLLSRIAKKRRSGSDTRDETDDAMQRALDALPAETREAVTEVADEVTAKPSRAVHPVPSTPPAVSPIEAGAALTLAPQLFNIARKRISLMFRIRLGLAVVLGAVLVTALIGCIFSVFIGEGTWAIFFGALTLVDVLGFAFSKPLKAVTDALVATQQLEWLNLRVRVDLATCTELADPQERIDCQGKLWESVQAHLATMSG